MQLRQIKYQKIQLKNLKKKFIWSIEFTQWKPCYVYPQQKTHMVNYSDKDSDSREYKNIFAREKVRWRARQGGQRMTAPDPAVRTPWIPAPPGIFNHVSRLAKQSPLCNFKKNGKMRNGPTQVPLALLTGIPPHTHCIYCSCFNQKKITRLLLFTPKMKSHRHLISWLSSWSWFLKMLSYFIRLQH